MNQPLTRYEENKYCLPNQYSLQAASPGPDLLKRAGKLLQDGMRKLLESDRGEEALQYGCIKGRYELRHELAAFLSRQYGQSVDQDELVITSGACVAVELLLQLFHPEQWLFIEDPTYFAIAVHSKRTNTPVPIKTDKEGMDLDALEEKLKLLPEGHIRTKPFRAVAYVVAHHHNPTGVSYSPEKCQRLVELARKYDVLVLCDDVYVTLGFDSDPKSSRFPSQRLFAYDSKDHPNYKGNIVSIGSLSKCFAPGTRIGWIEAPKAIGDLFVKSITLDGGSGMCPFVGAIMTEILKSGDLDAHVQMIREIYKERYNKFAEVLDQLKPLGVTFNRPSGGCFLWLQLPPGVSVERVLEVSLSTENVTFALGSLSSPTSSSRNCIRLSFAFYELPELIRGAEGLCRAIRTVVREHGL